ncbi:hypothetical protein DCS_01806 [Drechmeria coniospora]|uniref:Fasciclin domain family protein n=1 Tax=Drechmeria coniospora TaxID=98403 RepID=A0A151GUB5_DRECN|nr:hypothetical protein DCS_01806 [Drechmeria coniospora]KYK60668.1 hypothetical protein DCS_01806 [Drechmeria coniospora]
MPEKELQAMSSQTSVHFPLEPLPASVLAARETTRRNNARALGLCRSGCEEFDDHILLAGGLERGSVTGVSCEDEDGFGLVILARHLCDDKGSKALVITPRPAGVLLGALRDGIGAELAARGGGENVEAATRRCLERVMLSCVFDIDGLWEVLADLDRPVDTGVEHGKPEPQPDSTSENATKEERIGTPVPEIQDSEDDEALTPSPPPKQDTTSEQEESGAAPEAAAAAHKDKAPTLPSVVLVTHFSVLLTGLFAHREKSAAHTTIQLLSSQIRYLSRSLPSQPLFLLLNSTSSSSSPSPPAFKTTTKTTSPDAKPLEPTLRSIFNPAPLAIPGYHPPRAAIRRNKPSFGIVFSQMLDLHLLCTRVPKTRPDADARHRAAATNSDNKSESRSHGDSIYAAGDDGTWGPPAPTETGPAIVKYVTVVEVLLDDMGLWQGKRGHRPRREQRWGVVDVVSTNRVVNAIIRAESLHPELPTARGFGGRRP